MSRAATAILSTEHLLHNLYLIKNQSLNTHIIAMVKANAYGHGLRSTALRLEKHVYSFGVASIDEALALRKVGIKIPITLMEGVFEQDELLVASCENFHVVFHDSTQLEWLDKSNLPVKITAWLKIDTGMGRLGFSLSEAQEAFERMTNNKNIIVPIGLMSHFACSEQKGHQLNSMQIDAFNFFVHNKPGKKSMCNSAAIFSSQDIHYDVIRPGLALYGVSPFLDVDAHKLGLKPVMHLQTRILTVKTVPKNSSIGYGADFICPEDMKIGIVAMGYGDGYPRSARNGTPVLVNGVRCSLVGRVSMDMLAVDLRNVHHAQVNDPVVLWGNGLPIEEVARHTNQSVYDMLTAIQSRVKFYWTMNH
jgi:alanine racemase